MPHPAPPTPRARRCGQHRPMVCRHRLLKRAGCWLKETKLKSCAIIQLPRNSHNNTKVANESYYFHVYYHGCSGATCREIMSLQPAPRAQITSWPTGSVALLEHNTHIQFVSILHTCAVLWTHSVGINWKFCAWYIRVKTEHLGRCTCKWQPAELGSSSWPARGSGQSAGWGSEKSLISVGYFLWPLATPPDPPPDSH